MNERLMNSEHVYRLACEFTGAAYIYFDLKNDKRVELFGAWEDLTGEYLSRQPYDERFMMSLVHDDDIKMLREYLSSYNPEKSSKDGVEFRTKHGNKWIRAMMLVNFDNSGRAVERLISFQDVTDNHTHL